MTALLKLLGALVVILVKIAWKLLTLFGKAVFLIVGLLIARSLMRRQIRRMVTA